MSCARTEWFEARRAVAMAGAEERDQLLRVPRWRWYLLGLTRGRWSAPRPKDPPRLRARIIGPLDPFCPWW